MNFEPRPQALNPVKPANPNLIIKKLVSIRVHSWFLSVLLAAGSVAAAPLDDQIAAFKAAPTQTEGAVSAILQSGLKEHRSAMAFAAVKPWLTANPSSSQSVLYQAGQAAEHAGDWSAAVSFYRKQLMNPKLDGGLAAEAVPAIYRLLINHLDDSEAAYLFMREEGARLREFGRARQFDSWFFERAAERGDLVALTVWLTAIYNGDEPLDSHAGRLDSLLRGIGNIPTRRRVSLRGAGRARGGKEDHARGPGTDRLGEGDRALGVRRWPGLVGAKQKVPDEILGWSVESSRSTRRRLALRGIDRGGERLDAFQRG